MHSIWFRCAPAALDNCCCCNWKPPTYHRLPWKTNWKLARGLWAWVWVWVWVCSFACLSMCESAFRIWPTFESRRGSIALFRFQFQFRLPFLFLGKFLWQRARTAATNPTRVQLNMQLNYDVSLARPLQQRLWLLHFLVRPTRRMRDERPKSDALEGMQHIFRSALVTPCLHSIIRCILCLYAYLI